MAGPNSLIELDSLFTKLEVVVCFVDDPAYLANPKIALPEKDATLALPFPEEWKTPIQNAVQSSYRKETTGIHFTGFKNCSLTPGDADVAVYYSSSPDTSLTTG